jgi:hypothetical protein
MSTRSSIKHKIFSVILGSFTSTDFTWVGMNIIKSNLKKQAAPLM